MKLTQPQQQRMKRLLHMKYTPEELAGEIKCSVQWIERAIEAGCPYLPPRGRNKQGYIVGDEFRTWYNDMVRQRKCPMQPNEAYCLKCRAAVPLTADEVVVMGNGVERVTGKCPTCGKAINRFRSAQ